MLRYKQPEKWLPYCQISYHLSLFFGRKERLCSPSAQLRPPCLLACNTTLYSPSSCAKAQMHLVRCSIHQAAIWFSTKKPARQQPRFCKFAFPWRASGKLESSTATFLSHGVRPGDLPFVAAGPCILPTSSHHRQTRLWLSFLDSGHVSCQVSLIYSKVIWILHKRLLLLHVWLISNPKLF